MQSCHEAVGKLYSVSGAHLSACRGRNCSDAGGCSTEAENMIERDGCTLWVPSASSVGKIYTSSFASSCPKALHRCQSFPANRLQRAEFVAIPATARIAAENLTNRNGCTFGAGSAKTVVKLYT